MWSSPHQGKASLIRPRDYKGKHLNLGKARMRLRQAGNALERRAFGLNAYVSLPNPIAGRTRRSSRVLGVILRRDQSVKLWVKFWHCLSNFVSREWQALGLRKGSASESPHHHRIVADASFSLGSVMTKSFRRGNTEPGRDELHGCDTMHHKAAGT